MPAPDILVLFAHPDRKRSRANRALIEGIENLPRVRIHDLYALYPDYYIDVRREQAALLEARLVVQQHPITWYGMPPLLKLWFDSVYRVGWAYGPGGDRLVGRDALMVCTTGGPFESYSPEGYHRYPFETFIPPFRQTAEFCGMRWLKPMVLHGAQRISDGDLEAAVATYRRRLIDYPQGERG